MAGIRDYAHLFYHTHSSNCTCRHIFDRHKHRVVICEGLVRCMSRDYPFCNLQHHGRPAGSHSDTHHSISTYSLHDSIFSMTGMVGNQLLICFTTGYSWMQVRQRKKLTVLSITVECNDITCSCCLTVRNRCRQLHRAGQNPKQMHPWLYPRRDWYPLWKGG